LQTLRSVSPHNRDPAQISDVSARSTAHRLWHVFCSWSLFVNSTGRHHSAEPDVSGRAPERRIHHRVLVGAAAWLIVDDTRHSAECVNVSMGGAAVSTSACIPAGNVVSFELSLGNDHRSVTIQCEVVRAAKAELGLRFLALNRVSLEAIVSLL
jgi:PilZ domain